MFEPAWSTWRPATCFPDHCFCEAIRDQLVRQPANTLSGAAFLGVALLVLFSRRGSINAVYTQVFAGACALVGIGTIFYHASLTFVGQTVDVLGMYLVATFVVLYNLSRIRLLPPRTFAATYIAGNAALLAGLIMVPLARRYIFAALILLAIALEVGARRNNPTAPGDTRAFAAALVILLGGFAIWTLDITRAVCAPQSWLQGHAVWHLAGAASTWLVFRYLQSYSPRSLNEESL
jgi:hypothetical protein